MTREGEGDITCTPDASPACHEHEKLWRVSDLPLPGPPSSHDVEFGVRVELSYWGSNATDRIFSHPRETGCTPPRESPLSLCPSIKVFFSHPLLVSGWDFGETHKGTGLARANRNATLRLNELGARVARSLGLGRDAKALMRFQAYFPST